MSDSRAALPSGREGCSGGSDHNRQFRQDYGTAEAFDAEEASPLGVECGAIVQTSAVVSEPAAQYPDAGLAADLTIKAWDDYNVPTWQGEFALRDSGFGTPFTEAFQWSSEDPEGTWQAQNSYSFGAGDALFDYIEHRVGMIGTIDDAIAVVVIEH